MAIKLKLASYNIQNGVYEESIVKNIHTLVAEGVDVFCLQETRAIKQNFICDRLKNELGGEWQVEYFLGDTNPRIDVGLTMIWKTSKLKLKNLEKILLPKLQSLNFYERYVTSVPKPPQRGAMIASFDVNGSELRITNLHLDWQGGVSQRMNQVEYLTSHLRKKLNVINEVIAGDFNTIGREASSISQRDKIKQIFKNNFIEAFPDLKWTSDGASIDPARCFSNFQKLLVNFGMRFYQRLDYLFVKGIKLKEAKMEKMEGSDHYPLVITFEV